MARDSVRPMPTITHKCTSKQKENKHPHNPTHTWKKYSKYNVHETDSRSVGCIKNYTWQCFVNSVVSLSTDIYGVVFKPLRALHLRRSLPAQPTGAADATPDLKHTGKSI